MKKAFLHEDHNRQEKAFKPAYREQMRRRSEGTWSGMSKCERSAYKYTTKLTFDFKELKPLVAQALQSIRPGIDTKKLVNAIRSETCRHKSTLRHSSAAPPAGMLAAEVKKLTAQASKSIPGRFFLWHESIPDTLASLPLIPNQFHRWIERFVEEK
jgi:hypothetical protein